jgi:hypothetical protein
MKIPFIVYYTEDGEKKHKRVFLPKETVISSVKCNKRTGKNSNLKLHYKQIEEVKKEKSIPLTKRAKDIKIRPSPIVHKLKR